MARKLMNQTFLRYMRFPVIEKKTLDYRFEHMEGSSICGMCLFRTSCMRSDEPCIYLTQKSHLRNLDIIDIDALLQDSIIEERHKQAIRELLNE